MVEQGGHDDDDNENTCTTAHLCNRCFMSNPELSSFVDLEISDYCSWLTIVEPDVIFCCYSAFTPTFNVLCILGCFSALP